MIGIKAISAYIPENAVDNVERAKIFGESEDFVRNKIGATKLPIRNQDHDTSDLAKLAVEGLLGDFPQLNKDDVDAIVVVTQNPDGEGLPHTSAILQAKLGLPESVAAFDISLGCSGYIYGLYALKGFLEASGLNSGILITADPYSKIVNPEDRVTSLIFGDAATATWLGREPQWELGPVSYGTNGNGAGYLKKNDCQLHMNGRQIFNFALSKVGPHIKQLLRSSGTAEEEIDLYCLHQGSAAIVDAISKQFPEVSERFVKDIEKTGNTVSSSIPLLLKSRIFNNSARKVLISGFGVGLSWASAVISKSKN